MKKYVLIVLVLLMSGIGAISVSSSVNLVADRNEYPTDRLVNFTLTNNEANSITIIPFVYIVNITGGSTEVSVHSTDSPPSAIVVTGGGTYTYAWDQISHNVGINEPVSSGTYRGKLRWNNDNMAVSQDFYLYSKGDIDRDNAITASDALLYLRYAVGQNIAPFHLSLIDDVTCDGNIFADDALLILRKAVHQPVDIRCSSTIQ